MSMVRPNVALAAAALSIATLLAACTGSSTSGPSANAPDAQTLLQSARDDDDWIVPAKTYGGNRTTGLDAVTKGNVAHLGKAWLTTLADDGEQETSPIVWHGTMFVSTPHDNVLALDAKTGALKWALPYSPAYELQYAVNRGVGLGNGKVFIVTEDCRLLAIDAVTGKQRFNVPACRETTNTWYSTAAYVYKNTVVVGASGGDLGSMGTVNAFSTADERRGEMAQGYPVSLDKAAYS
ncbi:MAG: outer membrane protein assembly factor BamB family protein [Vulcanimicrobiaceae bacterium]